MMETGFFIQQLYWVRKHTNFRGAARGSWGWRHEYYIPYHHVRDTYTHTHTLLSFLLLYLPGRLFFVGLVIYERFWGYYY